MLPEMDFGIKTVTDSKLFSMEKSSRVTFPKITNSITPNTILLEEMVKTLSTLSDKEELILMDLKSTTSDSSEVAFQLKITSRMVISSKDINSDSITKNGLFSELKNSTDGNTLLKWKSDGETSTINTGPAELTFANSMPTPTTQTSTRHSPLAKKLTKVAQTTAKQIDLETFDHPLFTCINSLRFNYIKAL